jgi:hypothetical protein
MFRKFTTATMPAMIVAFIVLSTCDSGSQAFAGRGRGGGGHVRRTSNTQHHISHPQVFAKNTNKKQSFAQNQPKHSQHHDRRHRGYFGWGDSVDGDSVDGDSVDGDSVDGDSVDGDSGDGDVDVDPLDDEPVAAVLPITLLNPVATGRTVSYTLNSGDYEVDPAGSKVHNEGTQVIVFDRGGAFGQATYTLQPGTYRFAMTDKGLDLRTVTPQVATDQVAEQR